MEDQVVEVGAGGNLGLGIKQQGEFVIRGTER